MQEPDFHCDGMFKNFPKDGTNSPTFSYTALKNDDDWVE
jgi:hypothetical protein